jgi:outer membrane biosynthesis protein TonB
VITLEVTDGQWRVTSSISIFVKTHPDEVDTDGDGDPDGSDQDDDNDGVPDIKELEMGTNPRLRDTDLDGKNDRLDPEPLNPLVFEEENTDNEVTYFTILSLMIVLAVVILLIGSLLVLRRRSLMEKDRTERAVIAEGKIVSRYEELTGVGAPLLPQVKEMGLSLPPVAAQHVAPMKKAKELAETPTLPSPEKEEVQTQKAQQMQAPVPTPAPVPVPEPSTPEPVEKKPAPKRRIRRKTDDEPVSSTPGDIPKPEVLTGTAALPGSAEETEEKQAESRTTTCDLCGSSIDVPEGAQSVECCLLYTSPSPRDRQKSRMPSSA